MIPADQTDEVCKSNVGRDLGGLQSMSIVTTKSFTDCKITIKC